MSEEINKLFDPNTRLLELIERLDARTARLEEGFQLLTRLAEGYDSQLDAHRDWINQIGEAPAGWPERLIRRPSTATPTGVIRACSSLTLKRVTV